MFSTGATVCSSTTVSVVFVSTDAVSAVLASVVLLVVSSFFSVFSSVAFSSTTFKNSFLVYPVLLPDLTWYQSPLSPTISTLSFW